MGAHIEEKENLNHAVESDGYITVHDEIGRAHV